MLNRNMPVRPSAQPLLLRGCILGVLVGGGAGLACPVKSGQMLNGTVALHSSLKPICGAPYREAVRVIKENFKKAGKPLPANVWIEIYGNHGIGLEWIQPTAEALTKYERRFGLRQAGRYELPANPRLGAGGTVHDYRAPSGKALLHYTYHYSPTVNGQVDLWTYLVYIGN